MSIEWGLFNDEGLVAGDFWSETEAKIERDNPDHFDPEDSLTVEKVCPECRGGREDGCDECGANQ